MKKLAMFLWLFASVATAQNPQSQTAPIFAANAKYVNGVAPGYWPTPGAGLVLNVSSGTADCLGTIETYAGGTLIMTASVTNYVYLDTTSSCAPSVKTSAFGSSDIPIAEVITGASAITSMTDVRTQFTAGSGGGGTIGGQIGFPAVVISSGVANGLDPSQGLYGNGTTLNSIPALSAVRYQPVLAGTLPLTGNTGAEVSGNSIPAGVGSISCPTGTNPATGDCWPDLIAQDMGVTNNFNNLAVGADLTPDSINHILSDPWGLPTNMQHIPRMWMNTLNDADTKGRGAYEQDTKGTLQAILAVWTSDTSTRVRGQDVTLGTGWSLDSSTYTNWSILYATTNNQTQTIPFTVPSNGGRANREALYVLFPIIDLGTNGACGSICPGSVKVQLDGSGTTYTLSNASPVPVATANGATRSMMAYKWPLTSSINPGSHYITAVSSISGSQNYAGIGGVTFTPVPTMISSYSITASVPTFTALNGLPQVGQKIELKGFLTGVYFNSQVVSVTGVSGSTFTTGGVAGMPSSLGSTSEANAQANWAEPAIWVSGANRNLDCTAENDRDVWTYDNLVQDTVREWDGNGFDAQVNFVNTNTSWLNNSKTQLPGVCSHHPTTTPWFGEQQIKAAYEAPTFQPAIVPPSRKATAPTSRTVTASTVGGCYATVTDSIITIYSGTAISCYLPDQMSTSIAALNNQAVDIKFINAGGSTVTVSQNGAEGWTDSGIVLQAGSSIEVMSVNQGSVGANAGFYQTFGKNIGLQLPCAQSYTPGATYTIPATTTCQNIYGTPSTVATQTTYTFAATTGLTPGSFWQITNPISATQDAIFTNGVSIKIHPGYTATVQATSSTTLNALGQMPYQDTGMSVQSRQSAFTLSVYQDEWDFCGSNSAAWVLTLPTLGSGFHNHFHNACGWPITFTGASSGNANSATALPGEFFMIVSEASGRWDIFPVGSVKSAASASIGGSALAAGACTSGTITMQGVAAGMRFDTPAPSVDIGQGFSVRARVAATGTITVDVCNVTSISATPAAATYTVDVTP